MIFQLNNLLEILRFHRFLREKNIYIYIFVLFFIIIIIIITVQFRVVPFSYYSLGNVNSIKFANFGRSPWDVYAAV